MPPELYTYEQTTKGGEELTTAYPSIMNLERLTMKTTVWVLITDDENGTTTAVHVTQDTADAALLEAVTAAWNERWGEELFPGLAEARHRLSEGYNNFYDLDMHTVELPLPGGAEVAVTPRGFSIISFMDRYDAPCSLQDSSLATEACIWLGVHKNRAHLTQGMARDLLPALIRFLETGSIAISQE